MPKVIRASATTAVASTSTSEQIAIERLKKLFGADCANVQPNSGSQANQAVLMAFAKPGDTIMGMSLAEGGHLTHGMPLNMSGKWFNVVAYGLDAKEEIDYDKMEALAREHKPKIIIAGASAYSLRIDFERFAKIAKEVGAIFWVDMAHYAGLIAAGCYPNPVPFADVVTSTTHKTLRGPRGGVILMKAEHEKAINSAIFPGLQGGPLMHVIAAKAVAFKEAASPEFRDYQEQVVPTPACCRVCCRRARPAHRFGRTESHVFLVDLRAKNITGKEAEAALGKAHITVNKNGIPNDPQKPMVTSGIRIGSPAMTTRGFTEIEAERSCTPDRRRARCAERRSGAGRCARSFRCARSGLRKKFPVLRCISCEMKCPFCGASDTTVADTRINDDGDIVRRRRRCLTCDKRFSTYERAEIRLPQVVKKNGSRVDFDREKLSASLWLALRKRPVTVEAVEAAITRIEEKLLTLGEREILPRRSAKWSCAS
jgi:glycine hydroxymethyltransferase